MRGPTARKDEVDPGIFTGCLARARHEVLRRQSVFAGPLCGETVQDPEDPNALTNPKLIASVLSASTEAYDRGEKWAHYRRIESLEAYVLVSQLPERVELYERVPQGRDNAGAFLHRLAARGEQLPITCLGGTLDVEELYLGAL